MIGNWGITGAVRALRESRYNTWADPRLRALQTATQPADENVSKPTGVDEGIEGETSEPPLVRVAEASPRLSAKTLASVRVRGVPAPPITVSKRDSGAEIEAAWLALRAAFSRPGNALLLHHKNHYALIFATREWHRAPLDGQARERVRQILTARKGQRPTAWIDWVEVHLTLSGWAGYAIIEIAAAPIKVRVCG